MAEERKISLIMVSGAVPEPGYTKEMGAERIRAILEEAAAGRFIAGEPWGFQRGPWVNTRAIAHFGNVGKKSLTYAKRLYPDNIDEWQGWMRWREGSASPPDSRNSSVS